MSEQAPRKERQDAAKNRARILATAQDLFARQGVEEVSMNRIAQEAEVGIGTLYRHFSNKSELCFELMEDQITAIADSLATLASAGNDDPRETLKTMVQRYLEFKESKAPLFKGMEQAALLRSGGPTQSPVYETMRKPFIQLFERASSGQKTDDLADPAFRTDMLLATLIGDSFQFQHTSRGLTREDFAEKACAVFYPHG